MRAIAILAVATLLMAGCAADTPDPVTSSSSSGAASSTASSSTTSKAATSASTTASTSSTTTTQPTAPNGVPTAELVASGLTGTAPFNVTFTLKGSDPDADALTYTFDADGGATEKSGKGTEFPVTFTFQYKTAGNFTAKLVVSDGTLSANKTVVVKVTAATPTGTPIVWSGVGTGTPLGCLATDPDGTAYFEFNAKLAGSWHFSATSSVPGAALVTEWWSGETHVTDLGAEGVIPATADNVAVCGGVPTVAVDFELTLSPT